MEAWDDIGRKLSNPVESLPPSSLDISLPLAIQNCLVWREPGWTRFVLVHDRSFGTAIGSSSQVQDADAG
jgi:hypothetical protein